MKRARPDRRTLVAEPLDAAAFRPFGEVIDRRSVQSTLGINAGTAQRLHDLARIDAAPGGHAGISVVRAQPRALPFQVQCVERHRLGSQAFVPLAAARWLVVVAPGDAVPQWDRLRAFLASGEQGVNYRPGTWHHPLIALDRESEFLVVDRVADDGREDCEVVERVDGTLWIDAVATLR